jgi:hypothetical protein
VDTIQNLRQYIGHAPILMVGAGALKVRLNSEHTDWCWFSPKDIPENISLLVQLVVEQFVKTHG